MYRGPPIRPSAEFSAEISEARKVCHNIFKVLTGEGKKKKKKKTSKEEYSIQQGYYPELKKRNNFPDKQRLKEFITTKVNLK